MFTAARAPYHWIHSCVWRILPCAQGVAEAVTELPSQDEEMPPNYEIYCGYTVAKFLELEGKEQKRRAVPIDPTRTDRQLLPGGDDSRGWHNYWRRGVHGAL